MSQAISTDAAPAAIGPYSQALRSGRLLFCSGQIGMDPASGDLVEGGVAAEARQAFENLRAVLAAAGCGFEHAVKVTVYLADMADFAEVNGIYAEYFSEPWPARAAVAVLALPKGARIELDLIASPPTAADSSAG